MYQALKSYIAVCFIAIFCSFSTFSVSFAVSPEEQLSDPILEERARALSQQLRCLVCQNQSIDDSDADLARDLRLEVRTQLQSGKTDSDILEAIRSQYGDYVLLKPPVQTSTYLLWMTPVILLLFAILVFWMHRRSQNNAPQNIIPEQDNAEHTLTEDGRISAKPLLVSIAFIVAASIIAYSQLGRPDLTSQPLANRGDAIAEAKAASDAKIQLARKALLGAKDAVAKAPRSVDAQLRLAMTAAQANDFAAEQKALAAALELTDGDLSIRAMQAEAISREAGGLVTLPARQIIAAILEVNPAEPRALYLSGLAAFQDERFEEALRYWQMLQTLSTENAPWRTMLSDNIAQAAKAAGIPVDTPSGPDADMLAAAADMSAEDRQEMITSMVASLEDRLQEVPNDPAGWERLIQSRRVLNDTEGLIRALGGAADAFSTQQAYQLAVLETLLQTETVNPYLEIADKAVQNLRAIDPDGLEYLFFAGHFANVSGDTDTALAAWLRLQEKLPDDVPFAERLAAQIAALQSEK